MHPADSSEGAVWRGPSPERQEAPRVHRERDRPARDERIAGRGWRFRRRCRRRGRRPMPPANSRCWLCVWGGPRPPSCGGTPGGEAATRARSGQSRRGSIARRRRQEGGHEPSLPCRLGGTLAAGLRDSAARGASARRGGGGEPDGRPTPARKARSGLDILAGAQTGDGSGMGGAARHAGNAKLRRRARSREARYARLPWHVRSVLGPDKNLLLLAEMMQAAGVASDAARARGSGARPRA